jgi:hypothetical protein
VRWSGWGAVALATLLACASEARLALPAVGPDAAAQAVEKDRDLLHGDVTVGTLVVYSDALPVAKHRSPPQYSHTGYVIRKASGELVAHVDNRLSEAASEPDQVRLPPGLYEVSARCAGVGTVLVPVVIAPGRRTDVFLDQDGMPARQSKALEDPVRLPDGRVVGARATATAKAP